jgi:uncharacterized membrane-anchored protein YhcB (DUF1043 family)
MNWIVASGATCLGIFVGILVAYFVEEAEVMSPKVLSTSVSILAGGGVVAIFRLVSGPTGLSDEIWLYPVGLLVGFVVGTLVESLWPWETPPERRRSKR